MQEYSTRACASLHRSRKVPRVISESTPGHCLLEVAAVHDCVLTTGRGTGEVGLHTSRGFRTQKAPNSGTCTEQLLAALLYSVLVGVVVQHGLGIPDHRPYSAPILGARGGGGRYQG